MKTQCQALDDNGIQCKNKGIKKVKYHGDDEIYSTFKKDEVTWVNVWLCKKHIKEGKE